MSIMILEMISTTQENK
ncbi:hypothetical protein B6J96_21330 [Salmonella enterica subsp. enterica serovar Muenchen]|uniref:Uncharacterized protein n=1 Tax=Salmonella muenchen TaxID=596 RepID=A0A8E7P4U0_SALMU|nr:hypothetical protein B6J96_21330 [Salmonella enterica subsp. enterica serovar Muenchen]